MKYESEANHSNQRQFKLHELRLQVDFIILQVGSSIFVSGSIGLDPGSMLLVPGGIKNQALLALQHVDRVLRATVASFSLRDAVLVICYVILHDHVPLVEKVFKEYLVSLHLNCVQLFLP